MLSDDLESHHARIESHHPSRRLQNYNFYLMTAKQLLKNHLLLCFQYVRCSSPLQSVLMVTVVVKGCEAVGVTPVKNSPVSHVTLFCVMGMSSSRPCWIQEKRKTIQTDWLMNGEKCASIWLLGSHKRMGNAQSVVMRMIYWHKNVRNPQKYLSLC